MTDAALFFLPSAPAATDPATYRATVVDTQTVTVEFSVLPGEDPVEVAKDFAAEHLAEFAPDVRTTHVLLLEPTLPL